MLSNFPIEIFDRTDATNPRWPTLGVKIVPQLPAGDAQLFPSIALPKLPPVHLLEQVVATAIGGHDQTYLERPCVRRRAMQVDTSAIGIVEFDASPEASCGHRQRGQGSKAVPGRMGLEALQAGLSRSQRGEMTQSPAARSQEAANQAEFFLTTSFAPAWKLAQRIGPLRRAVNSGLINRAVEKMGPRPYPFSTMAPYTSWPSLTDRRYDARHLAPVADDAEDLPAPERVAELFRRAGETAPCPKSTVLFAYFAMWFTDGFLRSDRAERPDPRKNDSTHEIDLCQIYGLTGEATAELRRGELGLLKSQMLGGEEFPPYLYENGKRQFSAITVAREEQVPPERKAGLLAIGTDTANVQIGHVMMNVLFIREHNRIATELLRENPGWDDERLFQTTRNILIVLLIKIVIEEYINHITPYHFRFCLEGGWLPAGTVDAPEPDGERVQPALPVAQPDPLDPGRRGTGAHDRGDRVQRRARERARARTALRRRRQTSPRGGSASSTPPSTCWAPSKPASPRAARSPWLPTTTTARTAGSRARATSTRSPVPPGPGWPAQLLRQCRAD